MSHPIIKVKNPEPNNNDPDWVHGQLGLTGSHLRKLKKSEKIESEVIKIMRRSVKPTSFKLWRKIVNQKSIKHRKKLEVLLKKMII